MTHGIRELLEKSRNAFITVFDRNKTICSIWPVALQCVVRYDCQVLDMFLALLSDVLSYAPLGAHCSSEIPVSLLPRNDLSSI